MGVILFQRVICPKVNVKALLDFELVYFEAAIKHFSHYTTGTLQINQSFNPSWLTQKIGKGENITSCISTGTSLMIWWARWWDVHPMFVVRCDYVRDWLFNRPLKINNENTIMRFVLFCFVLLFTTGGKHWSHQKFISQVRLKSINLLRGWER